MIVTQTLQQLLPDVRVYTSPKNFNGELGMSLSIFGIESYTPSIAGVMQTIVHAVKRCTQPQISDRAPQVLVLEYGIDHPWEMEFLLSIVKPHVSIHTQIDAVHSLQFGSPEGIAAEEFLLQQHTLESAFVNVDDAHLARVLPAIVCDRITYSATHEKTDTIVSWRVDSSAAASEWRGEHASAWREGDASEWHEKNTSVWHIDSAWQAATVTFNHKKTAHIHIPLLGNYHLAYAGVGLCLADIISYKLRGKEAFVNGAKLALDVSLQAGRRSIFQGVHESIIIDSSYNASPGSVKHILTETTERLGNAHPTYQPIFILGEMRELGTQNEKEHTGLAEFLVPYVHAGIPLFLVGESMLTIVAPWLHNALSPTEQALVHTFPNYAALWDALRDYVTDHAWEQRYCLVFKGSQNTIFLEEAIKYVLANPSDEAKLTRQWDWWAKKKAHWLDTSVHAK